MEFNLECDLDLFKEETFLKVLNKLEPIQIVKIQKDADTIKAIVKVKDESYVEPMTTRFYQLLADQKLKDRIYEETKDIRTLILANAFSKTSLIDY